MNLLLVVFFDSFSLPVFVPFFQIVSPEILRVFYLILIKKEDLTFFINILNFLMPANVS